MVRKKVNKPPNLNLQSTTTLVPTSVAQPTSRPATPARHSESTKNTFLQSPHTSTPPLRRTSISEFNFTYDESTRVSSPIPLQQYVRGNPIVRMPTPPPQAHNPFHFPSPPPHSSGDQAFSLPNTWIFAENFRSFESQYDFTKTPTVQAQAVVWSIPKKGPWPKQEPPSTESSPPDSFLYDQTPTPPPRPPTPPSTTYYIPFITRKRGSGSQSSATKTSTKSAGPPPPPPRPNTPPPQPPPSEQSDHHLEDLPDRQHHHLSRQQSDHHPDDHQPLLLDHPPRRLLRQPSESE